MKRVLVVEDLPQVAEHLKGLLGREQDVQVMGVQTQADAAITQATTERPEVVLVDALLQGKVSGAEVAKRIRAGSPGTRIVMVTVPQKPVTPRPDEGVDAVFVLPGGANEIAQALGGEKKPAGGAGATAVYSPKGGTGKTLITVNLATFLRRSGSSVAVMDGVMQFGGVRHFLNVPPEAKSIVDLPPGGAMKAALPEALWEGPGGVHYLLAPARPEQADLVAASELANAVGLLGGTHEHVVVDTPSRLGEDTLALLDAASAILVIVAYNAPAIENVKAALETFEELGYRKQKPILLVVDQADETGGLSKGALEHTVGVAVAAEIPTDRKLVAESLTKQEPFVVTAPNAPISQAIGALATALVAQRRK
ncbi:MAG: response regulator [Chloroflexota bacterium]|nr:response regulator [Chloroflexota bacterium]MDE3193265.1 response regulator [Chloroflexota bacterium]